MKPRIVRPGPLLLLILLFLIAGVARARVRAQREDTAVVSARLRELAKRAEKRRGWTPLRRYASSTRSRQQRGFAYFTLGYQEFRAGDARLAAQDFKASAATNCLLADFAAYYEALADQELNQIAEAKTALNGFALRFPNSTYRLRAENLLASLLTKSGEPRQALSLLENEPGWQTRSSSLLLIAQAQEALPDNISAARTYQRIYTSFPATAEARAASGALDRLRQRMGSSYPPMPLTALAHRVERLFDAGRFDDALTQYDKLLRSHPGAPAADAWRRGRAECFIRMRQYSQAIAALAEPEPRNPEADAKRLALKARAYELQGDEPSLLATLNEIYAKYSESPSYGDALAFAGGYFARVGNWRDAAPYYQRLVQMFPHGRYAVLASWRSAWYTVLGGNPGAARATLENFLKDYPRSGRAPAALYWLGEVERKQGLNGSANAVDRFLAARYTNSYYGIKARRKLKSGRLAAGAPAALLDPVALIPARPSPPLAPCGNVTPSESFHPYMALQALGIDTLGEQFLADGLARRHPSARFLFEVARLRSSNQRPAAAIMAAGRAAPGYDAYSFSELPESIWRILYPRLYWGVVRRNARANHLDPYLVMGLIRQESAFNPHATSVTHARGLMQMEPYTAVSRVRGRWRRRRVVRELYNPDYNIRISTRYLRQIVASFNDNLPAALASYNAGDTRVRQWLANSKVEDPDEFLETIPFTDTQAYVEQVLRDGMIYKSILTGSARFSRCR